MSRSFVPLGLVLAVGGVGALVGSVTVRDESGRWPAWYVVGLLVAMLAAEAWGWAVVNRRRGGHS